MRPLRCARPARATGHIAGSRHLRRPRPRPQARAALLAGDGRRALAGGRQTACEGDWAGAACLGRRAVGEGKLVQSSPLQTCNCSAADTWAYEYAKGTATLCSLEAAVRREHGGGRLAAWRAARVKWTPSAALASRATSEMAEGRGARRRGRPDSHALEEQNERKSELDGVEDVSQQRYAALHRALRNNYGGRVTEGIVALGGGVCVCECLVGGRVPLVGVHGLPHGALHPAEGAAHVRERQPVVQPLAPARARAGVHAALQLLAEGAAVVAHQALLAVGVARLPLGRALPVVPADRATRLSHSTLGLGLALGAEVELSGRPSKQINA
ncbi:Protein of unknown function [Gryllus bimaculatus]|nr:Protein of unknown function [Gryllus bimaculatus]